MGATTGYIVVLEGTGLPGSNHKGVRTIITYGSQDEFQTLLRSGKIHDRVVDEGVSSETAHILASCTSMEDMVAAAIATAGDDIGKLRLELENLRFLARVEGRLDELERAVLKAAAQILKSPIE